MKYSDETIAYIIDHYPNENTNDVAAAVGLPARIVRHIEWEDRDAKPEWRAGVQEFYDLPKDGF